MENKANQKQGSAGDKNGGTREDAGVCHHQLDPLQVDSRQIDPLQIDPWQIDPLQIDPLQIDPWQTPLCELPVTLAYSAVVNVRNAESVITDTMVLQACQDIESMQQFPFAPRRSAPAS